MRNALVAMFVAVAVSAAPAMAQEAEHAHPDRPADVVLTVEGFDCDHCSAKLQKELAKLEGAEAVVAAEWQEGTVSIWLSEGADLDDELLEETVKGSGYVLKEVKRAAVEAAPAT
jgi:copper chaperone CopZ